MATLTLMFPDDNGIELQKICLSGESTDFSEWLSESAIALIEQRIQQENDSAYLCSIAVDYENVA